MPLKNNILGLFASSGEGGLRNHELARDVSQRLEAFAKGGVGPVSIEREMISEMLDSNIPDEPRDLKLYMSNIMDLVVSNSVNTSAPGFIGHMTTPVPDYIIQLSGLIVGLNQNVVKVETSKIFTPLERQVVGMMHKLVYNNSENFYARCVAEAENVLGNFCSGGTLANISALWVARNNLFLGDGEKPANGVEGGEASLSRSDCSGLAIVVSERGHYSVSKAADMLGIGKSNVYSVPVDETNKVDVSLVKKQIECLHKENIKVVALVGVAGTTETGHVDPLDKLADIAEFYGIHFHVDAAWGGASLLSSRYRELFKGIERADSVTIDGHKQMYIPIGCGVVLYKDSASVDCIKYNQRYILRSGDNDLGSRTLEGSRPGTALLMHAVLNVFGKSGFEYLINLSGELAERFFSLIKARKSYEVVTEPELCILTYRYVPSRAREFIKQNTGEDVFRINQLVNELNAEIQDQQKRAGQSFVSRTTLKIPRYNRQEITVFRSVLANPFTTEEVLEGVLDEQENIALECKTMMDCIDAYITECKARARQEEQVSVV